jgi:hypothetical protein
MKVFLADFNPYMLFSNLKTLFTYFPASVVAGSYTLIDLPISYPRKPLTNSNFRFGSTSIMPLVATSSIILSVPRGTL